MAVSPRSRPLRAGQSIAFELLTGRVPFIGATPMDVMVGHVSKPAPRLRTFEPSLPAELDELLARMLAKEPEQRPQTIEEVRAVLEDVLVAGGDAPPRPSQTNLKRLSGFDAPRPATPPAPLQSVQTPPVPTAPPAAPEPLPVVMGTVLESGTSPSAVPGPLGPAALTPIAASVADSAVASAPRVTRTPGGSPTVGRSNPSLSRVSPAPAPAPPSSRVPLLIGVTVLVAVGALLTAWVSGALAGDDVAPTPAVPVKPTPPGTTAPNPPTPEPSALPAPAPSPAPTSPAST